MGWGAEIVYLPCSAARKWNSFHLSPNKVVLGEAEPLTEGCVLPWVSHKVHFVFIHLCLFSGIPALPRVVSPISCSQGGEPVILPACCALLRLLCRNRPLGLNRTPLFPSDCLLSSGPHHNLIHLLPKHRSATQGIKERQSLLPVWAAWRLQPHGGLTVPRQWALYHVVSQTKLLTRSCWSLSRKSFLMTLLPRAALTLQAKTGAASSKCIHLVTGVRGLESEFSGDLVSKETVFKDGNYFDGLICSLKSKSHSLPCTHVISPIRFHISSLQKHGAELTQLGLEPVTLSVGVLCFSHMHAEGLALA